MQRLDCSSQALHPCRRSFWMLSHGGGERQPSTAPAEPGPVAVAPAAAVPPAVPPAVAPRAPQPMPTDDGFSAPEALPVETQPAETPGFVDGLASSPAPGFEPSPAATPIAGTEMPGAASEQMNDPWAAK